MEQGGVNKERLGLVWASAAEGERFASKVREMKATVENATPKEIETAQKLFEKALDGA
jgi:coenzyme F420-reducing hydrogenase delta subunit